MKSIIIKSLYDFLCIFALVYISYSVFFNRNKKEYSLLKDKDPIKSYIARYNLNMKKTNYKTVLRTLTFINSLIISLVTVIFMNVESTVWGIVISFVIIIVLIYSLYELTGKYFKRKEK